MDTKCLICKRIVLPHAKQIRCVLCFELCHVKCLSLNSEEQSCILSCSASWYCCYCIGEALPFNNIIEDEEFKIALYCKDHFDEYWDRFSYKLFEPLDKNEFDCISPLDDVDPDLNFYHVIFQHMTMNCSYLHEQEFNDKTKLQKSPLARHFFVFHINIRSLKHNLTSLTDYLDGIEFNFPIIGISETWLTDNTCDLYGISGYTLIEKHRSTQVGGGVAIFCSDTMNVVQRVDLSIFNEFIESVFVEIPNDVFRMGKSIVIGVIYRPPGTDVSQCNILLNEILSKIQKEGKICYLLGDYNINLFNYEVHSPTAEFIDLMYSHSFVPLVNRPTRISGQSATLIDNIFTNNYQNVCETMQAILVTDISDHFPVIHINWNAIDDNHELYVVKRLNNQRNRLAFSQAIQAIDWSNIYNKPDTQSAFTCFHETICKLYDKHFPKRRIKINYSHRKPWLTDGLRQAIKTKNKLYRKNLKVKSCYNEMKYKTYRNKLRHILLKQEKNYYAELLQANRSNMKKTWSILKSLVNKSFQWGSNIRPRPSSFEIGQFGSFCDFIYVGVKAEVCATGEVWVNR